MAALEIPEESIAFSSRGKNQSSGENYPSLSLLVSLDYTQWQSKKNGKLGKKKVDSISMIQLAICCGIQGDSFSHTLA